MIWETFSKRQKRLEQSGQQDVYQYDTLPNPFRVQVVYIWKNSIGRYYAPQGYSYADASPANKFWQFIHDTLARELGLPVLAGQSGDNPKDRCIEFLLQADTSGALDIIELSFRVIDRLVREMDAYVAEAAGVKEPPDDAIEELNGRFQEHGIGYQYAEGILVRLDSQFAHAEIVKPALSLLNAAGFEGPADEFIQAFEHYRHGRNKEAVTEALKAFESTMKSICAARKWPCDARATAKQLIEVVLSNGLVPAMLESHFTGLRAAMESGLPTLRNKTSGHGQGPTSVELPAHLASYALHLAASNIVLLVEAHKNLK